jgi:hypothetical protein
MLIWFLKIENNIYIYFIKIQEYSHNDFIEKFLLSDDDYHIVVFFDLHDDNINEMLLDKINKLNYVNNTIGLNMIVTNLFNE